MRTRPVSMLTVILVGTNVGRNNSFAKNSATLMPARFGTKEPRVDLSTQTRTAFLVHLHQSVRTPSDDPLFELLKSPVRPLCTSVLKCASSLLCVPEDDQSQDSPFSTYRQPPANLRPAQVSTAPQYDQQQKCAFSSPRRYRLLR